MKCEKCGAELHEEDKFCGSCGTPVPVQKEKRKPKIGVIIAVGVIVAIILGVVVENVVSDYFYPETEIDEEYTYISESGESEDSTEKETEVESESVQEKQNNTASNNEETQNNIVSKSEETQEPEYRDGILVEEEVTSIRKIYNNITEGISNNMYEKVTLSNGITAYYSGEIPVSVVVKSGVNGSSYTRYYYYDSQQLIFAYYEGSDAHRFYFYGHSLMRWRYSKNASKAQDAVNHDWEETSEYLNWEQKVWEEGMSFQQIG